MREKLSMAGKSGVSLIYIIACNLYILGTFIFIPYYNWQAANKEGFVSWLCFGEVVSTLKGAAWPYFLVSDYKTAKERAKNKIIVDQYGEEIRPIVDAWHKQGEENDKLKTETAGKTIPEAAVTFPPLMDQWVREDIEFEWKLSRISPPPLCKNLHVLLTEGIHSWESGLRQESALLKAKDYDGAVESEADSRKKQAEWKVRFDAEVDKLDKLM